MNRVNIILATFNGEKYIKEQIDSIRNNSFTNWKLWIFDDGSTDKTSSVIQNYIDQYPDKIWYQKNTRNKGVTLNFLEGVRFAALSNEKAKDTAIDNTSQYHNEEIMDYYMFSDQDDVWMVDKIEKTLNHMKKLEKRYGKHVPLAVYTDAIVVDDKVNVIHSSFSRVSKLDNSKTDLPHIMMENKLIGCTVMFNEQLRKKMSKLPTQARYHDWWIAMIAAAFGHISYLQEATLFYRQHSNNVVGNQSFSSYVRNRITSLRKQKESLHKIVLQADNFYKIYEKDLSKKEKVQVYHLAHIEEENWIKRRLLIIIYGYMKTGIVRNLGLFWLV